MSARDEKKISEGGSSSHVAHAAPTYILPGSKDDENDTNAGPSMIKSQDSATRLTTIRSARSSSKMQRAPSLSRGISHRDWYDAESASVCGESGSYTDGENLALRRQASYVSTKSNQTSKIDRSHMSRSVESKVRRKAPQKTNNISEERHGYIDEDTREKTEEVEILRDVQRGHSGESVREKYEPTPMPSDESSAPKDLEKQADNAKHLESGTSESSSSSTRRESISSGEQDEKDPNLVTWDSPDSKENPRNWSLHRRWGVIIIVSTYTFLSPLSSSMIAPALPQISADFNLTSSVLQSLMLSVFVLAYAIGPLLLAPLSEMFGRRIVLQSANVFFIIFTVACAVAQSHVQLSIFRFFAGLGGSAPLTIGGGTVSDLMAPEERGVAMSIYSLGPLMGPALGPIIGGWLIQSLNGNESWRWIFGVASIAAGVTAIIGFFILPETYAPVILARKVALLKKETGNLKLHTIFDKEPVSWQARFKKNLIRPFVLITTQPIIQVLGVYLMIIYGCIYLVLTSFSRVFEEVYGESVGIASLNYISLAIGFTLGGQICGRFNDYNYKRLKALNNGIGQPEFKLPVMMYTAWMPAAGLLIYGWTAQYRVHWIAPNIGALILAFGMIATFQCVQTYTVDTYTLYAASALSANTFLRSLAGFALPLGSGALYANLGYGWGNTLLGLIAAVVGIPAPFLLYKYGARIRAKSQYAAG